MSHEESSLITTRSASEILQVHVRTVRKWIDSFQEYVSPQVNEKGHYVLTPESFMRLKEIKVRMQDSNKSMRQVKEELVEEGKLVSVGLVDVNQDSFIEKMDKFEEKVTHLCTRLEKLETHMYSLFNIYKYMEHKMTSINNDSFLLEEIKEYLYHIEQNQDDLRGEIRNLTLAHQLTSATNDELPARRHRRDRFFRLF